MKWLIIQMLPAFWLHALIAARVLPLFMFCPPFGADVAPKIVRLGLTLGLSAGLAPASVSIKSR